MDSDDHYSAKMKKEEKDAASDHNLQPYSLFKQRNPLQIDLILEIFFSFCSASTLKNCRLVCKKWRDLSLKAWREKAILNLSKEMGSTSWSLSLRDYLLQHIRSEKSVVSLIPDEHLQLGKYPFRNFRIDRKIPDYYRPCAKPITDVARHVILQDSNRSCYDDLGLFFSKFRLIEDLEILNCKWLWMGQLHSHSHNVKRIRIFHDESGRNYTQNKFFFQPFPNLKTFCLEYRRLDSCSKYVSSILRFLRSCAKDEKAQLSLKELEIINVPPAGVSKLPDWRQRFDETLLKTIEECDLSLERFALDLAFSDKIKITKAIRSLHPLLDSWKDTLQYLRTSFYFDMDHFIECVAPNYQEKDWEMKIKRALKPVSSMKITLDKVHEMKLANGLWGFYLLAHLHLPNLEKLVVEYGRYTKKANIQHYQVQLLKEKVYGKLETFELLDCYQVPEPDTISLFRDMMPNLTHLTVPLDKKAFRIVCRKFTGLKTLNILSAECRYEKLDDNILTGCSKRSKQGGHGPPNITDLNLLTDLIVSSDVAFTDQAVVFGFLQLPKLHFLSAAFREISHEIKENLLHHVKGSVQIKEEQSFNLVYSESDRDIESDGDNCSESESSDESTRSSEEDSEEDSELDSDSD